MLGLEAILERIWASPCVNWSRLCGISPWIGLYTALGLITLAETSAFPFHLHIVFNGILLSTGFSDTFNIDTKRPKIIAGSKDAYFGYTVQQHDIGGKKW